MPDSADLAGLAWHHALHARISIERRRWWQAEHCIGALRTHILALACLRLGHPASYAKGAHLLPTDLTEALEPTEAGQEDGHPEDHPVAPDELPELSNGRERRR